MKTTKKHFKIFKKELEYWIEKFQLREWAFTIVHEDSKREPNSLAWYWSEWRARAVVIGLSKDWGKTKPAKHRLCRSAFHEACEILLSDMASIGMIDACPTQKQELESKAHSIIRRLEWAVWKPDYKKRN